jgi:hypothetical protein
MEVKKRVPLEGAELDQYLKTEKGKIPAAVKTFVILSQFLHFTHLFMIPQ